MKWSCLNVDVCVCVFLCQARRMRHTHTHTHSLCLFFFPSIRFLFPNKEKSRLVKLSASFFWYKSLCKREREREGDWTYHSTLSLAHSLSLQLIDCFSLFVRGVDSVNNVMGHPEEVDVIVCGGGPAGIFSQPFFKIFFHFHRLLAFSPFFPTLTLTAKRMCHRRPSRLRWS